MAANCHKCRLIILTATKAQAEQANKAAEMLLAMLAEEEEMAKTKKEKKQKKREEKKAKKSKKVETDKAKSPPVVDCKDDEPPRVKEEHSEVSISFKFVFILCMSCRKTRKMTPRTSIRNTSTQKLLDLLLL